jgi:hypothetical protein
MHALLFAALLTMSLLDRLIHRKKRVKKKKGKAVDERRELDKKISGWKRLLGKLASKIDKAKALDKLDTRACIDGATTWLGLKLVLLDCRENGGWDGVVNAADRTSHADDCGDKSSQQELYDCWRAGNPSCAPANPPGTGSHEGVNGGGGGTPAYGSKFPVGAKLPWWAWGLDLSDPEGFVLACDRLGYKVFRAHMPREPWHFNFEENPTERLRERNRI